MATSQMEEMVIFKQRDRAIAAIVDRHPYTNLRVQDEHYVLRVIAPDAHEWLTLDPPVSWEGLDRSRREYRRRAVVWELPPRLRLPLG